MTAPIRPLVEEEGELLFGQTTIEAAETRAALLSRAPEAMRSNFVACLPRFTN